MKLGLCLGFEFLPSKELQYAATNARVFLALFVNSNRKTFKKINSEMNSELTQGKDQSKLIRDY